jgi:pimeloyl-ACP methyl ester carboxylesterase
VSGGGLLRVLSANAVPVAVVLVAGVTLTVLVAVFGARAVERRRLAAVREGLDRLEDRLAPLVRDPAHPRHRAALCLRVAVDHLRRQVDVAARESWVETAGLRRDLAARVAETAAALRGEDVFAGKRGAFLKGYRSGIDNSIQAYSVHVPPAYDGAAAVPLVVHLHGFSGFGPFQGHPAPAYAGAITLAPHGRGATDYKGLGEDDVLRTLEEVRRDYRIDPDRVYLVGHSMGGTGAWHLASRYPDRFAGIVPTCGNADYRVWAKQWGWVKEPPGGFTDLRRRLRAADSAVTFAGNLLHVPAYCAHGAADMVVPVGHSRNMVAALEAAGCPVEYREFFWLGHGGFPGWLGDDRLSWVAARKRPRMPPVVRLAAARLRHGRAYWCTILKMRVPAQIARVEARIGEDNRVAVATENVARLRLAPAGDRIRSDAPLQIAIDGAALSCPGPAVVLERDAAGAWRPAPRDRPARLEKRAGLEGPVEEVFLAPFAVVYGTGGAADPGALKREAERVVREWKRRYNCACRLLADTEVTDAHRRDWNLVLFGTPAENRVLASIADRLPIRIGEKSIRLGDRTYRGPDVGTIFCWPNPEHPDRLVAVFAGLGPEAIFQVQGRFGNWFDWGVYDSRKWFDYAVFDARSASPETFLAVGFFDADWRLDPKLCRTGVESLRAGMAPARCPTACALPDAPVVYLSDLMPWAIDQMRGAVGFDRSYRGHPLAAGGVRYEKGLGVRAPSVIVFGVEGNFRRFRAVVGLADEPEDAAMREAMPVEAVRFRVFGDDALLAESDLLDVANPVCELDVPFRGVKALKLEVRPVGGAPWLHGSSVWASARLERGAPGP